MLGQRPCPGDWRTMTLCVRLLFPLLLLCCPPW